MNRHIALILLLVMLCAQMITSAAHAGALAYTLCYIHETIIYTIGPGIASLAVLGLGIAATTGKISVTAVMAIGVGMSLLFSAPYILYYLMGINVYSPLLCG